MNQSPDSLKTPKISIDKDLLRYSILSVSVITLFISSIMLSIENFSLRQDDSTRNFLLWSSNQKSDNRNIPLLLLIIQLDFQNHLFPLLQSLLLLWLSQSKISNFRRKNGLKNHSVWSVAQFLTSRCQRNVLYLYRSVQWKNCRFRCVC